MKEDYPLFVHWYKTLDWVLSTMEHYPKNARFSIASHISDMTLKIMELKATWINCAPHGLNFLGMRIFPRFIRVKFENRKRSLRRLKNRIRAWQGGKLDEESMTQSLNSICAHLRYFCPHTPIAYR
ncbi:MAG TPA: hypothetical protein VJL89_01780 [Thermodesulfovibrionia bacterium]|nr:hypothetical protein [Thermodesulfovibrionia bacterium]